MRAARLFCAAMALAAFASTATAATLNVPGTYATIQAAVNAAAPSGDVVAVAAGTYVEQVTVVGKDLTIQGAGSGSTFVEAPAALATTFTTSGPNKPVITADGAADVRIMDLTVDGMGNGNANNRIVGIGFWNAGGKVLNCVITRVRNTPIDGVQAGNGILAANNTGGPYAIEIGSTTVTDFQKNGMTLAGTGLTVNVHDCTVTGAGSVNFIAQNGIQISGGAGGSVSNTNVSAIRYTPASVVACGLLLYGPGGSMSLSNIGTSGLQQPVYWLEYSGSINGITIGAQVSGQDYTGIYVDNSTASVAQGAQLSASRRIQAEPFDLSASAGRTTPTLDASYSMTIDNGCLDGGDPVGVAGIYAYSAGGPLSVGITNTNILNYDAGIVAEGAAVSITANNNSIASNLSAGFDNTLSGAAQNAENNWWGAADGPGGAGTGAGDDVLGANVDFSPWLASGSGTNPSCVPQPAAPNVVAAGPAPSCVSIGNPCITIPVKITRTDATGVRGYSVTFQLSANLQLCNATGDITSGGYLISPNMQVISNGGGSYTVDEATLGLPCGATGNGTLFNIPVKSSSSTGTGTIAITSVILRDCSNAPVAASAGATLSITIDQVAPAAVTLSALQKKIGNSAVPAGTTDIQLSWTAPEAGATVAVYRKGFGGYPDYDEAGGFAPAAPATPAAALLAGWALSPVTSSGGFDRVATRDFQYFVAFVTDACGNVSVVSNRTNGTLNYHLGDTHNGTTNCAGENLVNTSDISFLGFNYGASGIPVAGAIECLDVGPTTDFSVDARPTTDHKVQFEDLIMFAINYGQVSAPAGELMPAAATNDLRLVVPALPAIGETFAVELHMSGAGGIQGFTSQLGYDRSVVEFVGAEAGAMLARQATHGVALSSGPGNVDVALLGVAGGIRGEGEIARALFRVKAAGNPAIVLSAIEGRDAENRAVSLGQPVASVGLPTATALAAARPTPFREATTLEFALARTGRVELSIYGIDGRRITRLVDGDKAAGTWRVTWNGIDERGRPAPAGVYFARLTTADGRHTRTLIRVQ